MRFLTFTVLEFWALFGDIWHFGDIWYFLLLFDFGILGNFLAFFVIFDPFGDIWHFQ